MFETWTNNVVYGLTTLMLIAGLLLYRVSLEIVLTGILIVLIGMGLL
jgi:hypothetical protein